MQLQRTLCKATPTLTKSIAVLPNRPLSAKRATYLAMALLSQTPPCGVSRVGTCGSATSTVKGSCHHVLTLSRQTGTTSTLPKGLSLRNSGVLFVLPISIGGTSIFAPTYLAAIKALKAFLFPGGDHSLYVAMIAPQSFTIRRRFREELPGGLDRELRTAS